MYDDGTTADVTGGANWSPSDGSTLKVTDTKVTCSYSENGGRATQTVQINVEDVPTKLSVQMSVTDYEVGDKLDTSGSQIVLTYSSGKESSLGVNDVTWNPKNGTKLTKEATQFITVTYGELTDRISVRVSAKRDEPEQDKKDRDISTGRDIADSLGGGGSCGSSISDEEAEAIANAASAAAGGKPNITDDQGRTWIPMESVIAAGKKMQEDGAFKEEDYYEAPTMHYKYVKTPVTLHADTPWRPSGYVAGESETLLPPEAYGDVTFNQPGVCVLLYTSNITSTNNRDPNNILMLTFASENGDVIQSVTGHVLHYTKYTKEGADTPTELVERPQTTGSLFAGELLNVTGVPINRLAFNNRTEQQQAFSAWAKYIEGGAANEEHHHSGGSAIDWTKSDEEIEQQVKELHETWDVSEHKGATTANGTYVLAGPIEYNPGD